MQSLGIKGFKALNQVIILVDEFLKFEAQSENFIDELETHINSIEEMISTSKLDTIVRIVRAN